jgi:hypothetical protein
MSVGWLLPIHLALTVESEDTMNEPIGSEQTNETIPAQGRTPADTTREALLRALGGSVHGWKHRRPPSEVEKLHTHCACGHYAQFLYFWHHEATDRWVATGSLCVKFVPELDPTGLEEIRAAVSEHEGRRREARREAQLTRNAPLELELWGMVVRLHREVWPSRAIDDEIPARIRELRTPAARIKQLEDELARVARTWARERASARRERALRAELSELRKHVWLSRGDYVEVRDLDRHETAWYRVRALESVIANAKALLDGRDGAGKKTAA